MDIDIKPKKWYFGNFEMTPHNYASIDGPGATSRETTLNFWREIFELSKQTTM